MILSTYFFYLLSAFMNFYYHNVPWQPMHFIQKLIFSFIWIRNSFNTETNEKGMEGNVVLIKLS